MERSYRIYKQNLLIVDEAKHTHPKIVTVSKI